MEEAESAPARHTWKQDALYQCVPNFSEGRRHPVVEAIAAAVRATPGVVLADYSADADHNRCVVSILGTAHSVRAAALAASAVAIGAIDLRKHHGAHPRVGALDVLPVVPVRGASRGSASALACEIGDEIAKRFGVPVYLYGWSARPGRENALPALRRGGFEALQGHALVGEAAPDFGPEAAHPTAGIAIVGARPRLVAYNISLDTGDPSIAKEIARQIRRERRTVPELAGVRALGLFLHSRSMAQVSMNLTLPDATSLPRVFEYVRTAAARLGAHAYASEVIGLISRRDMEGADPDEFLWRDARSSQIVENWIPDDEMSHVA